MKMHTFSVFLVLAALAFPAISFAQKTADTDSAKPAVQVNQFRPHVELGLSYGFGLNHTEINTHYAYDYVYSDCPGFNPMLSFVWQRKDWFGWRIDFSWIDKGVLQTRAQEATGMFAYMASNKYFEVPVMADFSFGGQRWRGHFDAGLYFGYWAKSNLIGVMDGVGDEVLNIYQYDEPYEFDSRRDNRFEMGYAASIGLSRLFGRHLRIQAEMALYYGITSTKVESRVVSDPVYNTTKVFNLGAYWCF